VPDPKSTSSCSYKEMASFPDLKAFFRSRAFGNWPTSRSPWTIWPLRRSTAFGSISKHLQLSAPLLQLALPSIAAAFDFERMQAPSPQVSEPIKTRLKHVSES
jgi:hypothetical protein